MRQFLLAGKVAYGADLPLAAGAVAFTYLANGEDAIDADGTKITDKFYINLGREANGPVVLPAYKKHLTFVKGVYQAATTFSAILTCFSAILAMRNCISFDSCFGLLI